MSMLRTMPTDRSTARERLATAFADHGGAVLGFVSVLAGPDQAADVTFRVFVDLMDQDAPADTPTRTALLSAAYQALGGPGDDGRSGPCLEPCRPGVDEADACVRLNRALDALLPRERTAVAVMSYCDGGRGDAAMVLGVPPEVLLADLRSGLTRLAELLSCQPAEDR